MRVEYKGWQRKVRGHQVHERLYSTSPILYAANEWHSEHSITELEFTLKYIGRRSGYGRAFDSGDKRMCQPPGYAWPK
jgi:hypothetical protein